MTINQNGHFTENGKTLKTLSAVIKASYPEYYNNHDTTFLALSTGLIETAAVKGQDLKELLDSCFEGHDPILKTPEGISELTKLGLKKRAQWEKKNGIR